MSIHIAIRHTTRYVDSSLERLQVQAAGLTDGRYAIARNGRGILLKNTGVRGEYVAGVRYRAWQPPSALHPTIGPHSPPVFDVIDLWNNRAIAGCTYQVMHPGGRNTSGSRSMPTRPSRAATAAARPWATASVTMHSRPGPVRCPASGRAAHWSAPWPRRTKSRRANIPIRWTYADRLEERWILS
ncbi:MAG TPA: transglutaminase family protein [Parasulfuritortus sp.]